KLWRLIELLDVSLSDLLLLLILVEDGAAVLRPDIGALAVERGGVVGAKEDFEDFFVRRLAWVVVDLNRLGMTGLAGEHHLVVRVGHLPAGIARNHIFDADHAFKDRFGAPKAASGKSGDGLACGGRFVHGSGTLAGGYWGCTALGGRWGSKTRQVIKAGSAQTEGD